MFEFLNKPKVENPYRIKMNVTKSHIYRNEVYPICPRCGVIFDRDCVNYCSNCGQHLGWEHYNYQQKKAGSC